MNTLTPDIPDTPDIPADFEFCPMSESDIDEVADIEMAVAQGPWSRQMIADSLSAGQQGWLLYRKTQQNGKKEIVAYALTLSTPPEADLLLFGVASSWQQKRLGTHLLQCLCETLQRQGIESIFLEVRRSNAPALALYARLHFIEVGLRRNYYSALTEGAPQEDALVMHLRLGLSP